MAEDRTEPREYTWRQRWPWTEIFQGFRIALDLNKLLLAAAGIMVMALGWWLLAWIFSISATKPEWKTGKAYNPATYGGLDDEEKEKRAWRDFKSDRKKWNLLHRAAGRADALEFIGAGDLAETPKEYDALTELAEKKTLTDEAVAAAAKKADVTDLARFRERVETLRAARADEEAKRLDSPYRKKAGELRTWPWFEDRGPNPYLLLTGQVPAWERGGFWDWLFRKQVPVLLEPLYKMVRPVILFFDADAGPLTSFYFLLVLLWTFVTWAIFGGAITRIAAVQIARQEKITLPEALRFTVRRWLSFVTAPVFPLLFVAFLVVFMIIYGAFYMIPYFGDIAVGGLFWWVMLFFGVLMAVALIGLVGWPLMYSTVSAEGTDSWEAVSRSYSYIFQAPWNYLGYWVVALAYGALLVLFVGFMGSFAVYLSKWGVTQTPMIETWNREPSHLFVYAPTSFGWRNLLLKDVQLADGRHVVDERTKEIIPQNYNDFLGRTDYQNQNRGDTMTWSNRWGAFLVAVWLFIFFLVILGFGYSYFWSASTIIYLLMRKKVDDAEMDEVYLEEEDADTYAGPLAAAPSTPAAPAAAPRSPSLTMVESPTLRPQPPAAPSPPPDTREAGARPPEPPPGPTPAAPPAAAEPPKAGEPARAPEPTATPAGGPPAAEPGEKTPEPGEKSLEPGEKPPQDDV